MKDKKRPGLPEARWAASRLLTLPDRYEDYTKADRDFIRSDIVGELLEGKWPGVFNWTSNTQGGLEWLDAKQNIRPN